MARRPMRTFGPARRKRWIPNLIIIRRHGTKNNVFRYKGMDRCREKDNNLAVYWHRPLGSPDVVRRLTIRRRQRPGQYGSGAACCWSCPIGTSDALSCSAASSSPPWRCSSSSSRGASPPPRLQILELDCPDHVDESFLASILDSVSVVVDGAVNNELRLLRSLRGCHDTVVRWFLQRFNWRIVELADHNSTVLASLPNSIIELRLTDDLSIQDWQTIVRRGQQLCQRDGGHPFLLRTLWLERAPRDPNVSTVLLRHVIRDTSFVVSGPPDVMKMMEEVQWYSALNVWSSQQQGKSRIVRSPPLPLSGADTRRKAVRIIKEWKQRLEQQPDDGPLVLTVQRPGQAAVVVDDSSPREQRGEVVVVAAVGPSPPRPPVAAVSKHNTRRTSGGGGGGVYVCPHRRKVKTTPFFQAPLVPSEARN
jgi:hypothetical protein